MPKRLHVRPFTVLLMGLALLGGSASAQVVALTSANTKSAVPAQDSPANPSIEDAPLTALPTHVKSGAPPVHGGFEVERYREVTQPRENVWMRCASVTQTKESGASTLNACLDVS